ncbi:hypothetical protein ACOSQ3_004249 [Xanthoceras sorbifolium]
MGRKTSSIPEKDTGMNSRDGGTPRPDSALDTVPNAVVAVEGDGVANPTVGGLVVTQAMVAQGTGQGVAAPLSSDLMGSVERSGIVMMEHKRNGKQLTVMDEVDREDAFQFTAKKAMHVHAKRARKPLSFDSHTTLSDMHSDGVEAETTGSSSSLKNKLGELVAMEVESDTGQCITRWKCLARGETPLVRISMAGMGSKHLGSESVVGDAGVMKKNKLNVEVTSQFSIWPD